MEVLNDDGLKLVKKSTTFLEVANVHARGI